MGSEHSTSAESPRPALSKHGPERRSKSGPGRSPSRTKWTRRLIGTAILGVLLFAGAWQLLGFRSVDFPSDHPLRSYDQVLVEYDAILRAIVTPDGVDYARLATTRGPSGATITDVAEAFGRIGPERTPTRFADENARRAYYLNAYNALVLAAVGQFAPTASIHEIRGPIEPKAGFGFFFALRFLLDGSRTSLYALEHDIIRAFGDPRVHAAINCASRSCPPLPGHALRAATLHSDLEQLTRAFVQSPHQVRVDGEHVSLSALFLWYWADFVPGADSGGMSSEPASIRAPGGIEHYPLAPLRRFLTQYGARLPPEAEEFVVMPYDWSLAQPDGLRPEL